MNTNIKESRIKRNQFPHKYFNQCFCRLDKQREQLTVGFVSAEIIIL